MRPNRAIGKAMMPMGAVSSPRSDKWNGRYIPIIQYWYNRNIQNKERISLV